MKIELEDKDVERIADAIVGKLKGVHSGPTEQKQAEPVKQAEEPKKEEPKKDEGPSMEDVRTALNDFAAIDGRPAAIAKMKEIAGVAALSEVPKDKYQVLIDALKKV